MVNSKYEKYIEIFRKNNGILRIYRAMSIGIPEHIIYAMERNGDLTKEARGLYRLTERGPLGNPDLVQVSVLVPKSVVFLISSLYVHRLTTQIPKQVYIALPQGVKVRNLDYPPLKVFHLSEKPYITGIEEHNMDGISVRIYNKEKTVTDCFKYRNKIGVEVAIEALKDYMSQPSPNVTLLLEYAKINRVEKLIKPYIETLL